MRVQQRSFEAIQNIRAAVERRASFAREDLAQIVTEANSHPKGSAEQRRLYAVASAWAQFATGRSRSFSRGVFEGFEADGAKATAPMDDAARERHLKNVAAAKARAQKALAEAEA
jgi:hypothetical protein